MHDWARAAQRALASGEPVAMVSILATWGSAPRGAGTRMLVTRGGCTGTIGGGNLEYRSIAQAERILDHPPGTWRVQDYPLGPLLGQCCGGRVRLLVERLDACASDWLADVQTEAGPALVSRFEPAGIVRTIAPGPMDATGGSAAPRAGDSIVEPIAQDRLPLALFGAGHVGRAVARVIDGLPIALDWFDSRPGMSPGVTSMAPEALEDAARDARGAVLVMTHDHALDYRLVRAALAGEARFVGLIGSATKSARFRARLAREGAAGSDRLVCPIGIEGITGKDPATIAVAVAAQLLLLHATQEG